MIAGDIAVGTNAADLFGELPVPVIYVSGNHEHYGGDIDKGGPVASGAYLVTS